jgi:hypothetical protein
VQGTGAVPGSAALPGVGHATLAAALAYAGRGWRVVALHGTRNGRCTCGKPDCIKSAGKHPIARGWVQAATIDPAAIRRTLRGACNVGIVTGPGSDLLVVDVDGAEGEATLDDLAVNGCSLPDSHEVRTGSGGRHVYYRCTAPLHGGTSKLGPKVDIRCLGGQVVAPPSISLRGPYVLQHARALAEVPGWIVTALSRMSAPTRPAPGFSPPPDLERIVRRARAYLAALPPAISGSGGHPATFLAAIAMVRGFELDPETAYSLLADWNEGCQPPWCERDLRRKVSEAAEKSTAPIGYLLRSPRRSATPSHFTRPGFSRVPSRGVEP